MCLELGGELVVLGGSNMRTLTGARDGRQFPSLPTALQIAVNGAHADTEDPRRLGFAHARVDGLDGVGAEIEGVGTHVSTLLSPISVSLSQHHRNLL